MYLFLVATPRGWALLDDDGDVIVQAPSLEALWAAAAVQVGLQLEFLEAELASSALRELPEA
jgi:hypothetical protein